MYQDSLKIEDKLKDIDFDWKGKSVLDMGCNMGLLEGYVMERGAKDYLGMDTSEVYINEGKKRNPEANIVKGNLKEYITKETDVLVLLSILHHIEEEDVDKVLEQTTAKEIICKIPTGKKKYIKDMFGERIKLRIIRSKKWYKDKFEEYGFDLKYEGESIVHGKDFRRTMFVFKRS